MNSTAERESKMVGGSKGPSVGKVFAFIALWPAMLPLIMMQIHCFAISALKPLPLFLGAAGGIIYAIRRFVIFSKNNGLVSRNRVEMKISPLRAITEAIIFGLVTASIVGLSSAMLIGDAVSFASRQPYTYETTITNVFHGGRGCAWNMEFTEETVNRTVSQCADQYVRKPEIGEAIKVNTLIGNLGTRITSIARIVRHE